MTKRFLLILLTALCARTACAFDEAAVDSLSSDFRLDEVEVTARLLSKDIIIPQTLRGAELQRLSVLNVADALRYFSGVQLKDYGGVGGIKTINIRSMGSQHTAVYYNGIQLGNAQNGQVDLGRFSRTTSSRSSSTTARNPTSSSRRVSSARRVISTSLRVARISVRASRCTYAPRCVRARSR